MSQELKFLAALVLLTALNPAIVFGDELNCIRTTDSSNGWKSSSAFNEVWPKELNLSFAKFSEAGGSSKALVYEIKYESGHKRVLRLLPNKKMIGNFVVPAGYVKPAEVRYKCNLSSNGVRQALAIGDSNQKAKETEKNLGNSEKLTVERITVSRDYIPNSERGIKEAIEKLADSAPAPVAKLADLLEDKRYMWRYLSQKSEQKAMVGATPLSCNYRYYHHGELNISTAIERAYTGCMVKIQKYNELMGKNCKCRVVALNNTLFYDNIVYLSELGYAPVYAEVTQNEQKFFIRGTVEWDNPGASIADFTLKNDKGIGICDGSFDIKNKAKGSIKIDCFDGEFSGVGTFVNAGYDEELRFVNGTAVIDLDNGSVMRVVYGRDAM